jgi:HSP20 family protein
MARSAIKVRREKRGESMKAAHPLTEGVLEKLRSELDDAFDRFSHHFKLPSLRNIAELEHRLRHRIPLSSIATALDVVEEDKLFRVGVELPGIEAKDIDVAIVDDTLVIKGEKRDEREKDARGYYIREREYGSFERYIEMPAEVDRDKIEADIANGVLTIVLPKTPEAAKKHKKISIKSA